MRILIGKKYVLKPIMALKIRSRSSCKDLLDIRQNIFFVTDGLHDKYIVYNWKSDNPIQIGNDADSFLNSENASLKYSGFTDDQMSSGTITTSTGDYSYLKLDFKFTK